MTEPAPAAPPGAEWNAHAYTRLSNPMQTWGEAILEQLALRGDETALDLGCGSGRLTEYLLRRLPQGRVIAVDRSANMLEAAREHLDPRRKADVDRLPREGTRPSPALARVSSRDLASRPHSRRQKTTLIEM